MSELSRKMFLAETAAVREHLAEEEQQTTAKAEAALRDRIDRVIREFPFDDFGLDDVSHLLERTPDTQEWVPKLAAAVLAELPSAADWDDLVREADRLRRDGMALHARAEELDTQLAALRQQVTEPADRNTAEEMATDGCTPACDQTPGIRGLLEHVGIDTAGRDIKVGDTVVDACTAEPAAGARQDEVWPVKEATRHYAEELRATPGQAAADGHTGWECDAGAQLLISATTPGPGALGTHHGTIYACPVHQGAALQRITGAGYQADPRPAPPGHRWNPWPCGHVTAHDAQALTVLTAAGARQDGDET